MKRGGRAAGPGRKVEDSYFGEDPLQSFRRVVALLVLAGAGAAISTFAASSDRKLAWVGSYPRALQVEPAGSPAMAEAAPPAVQRKQPSVQTSAMPATSSASSSAVGFPATP